MDEKDDKNFGFEKVTPNQKRVLVDEVFSDIAKYYYLLLALKFQPTEN